MTSQGQYSQSPDDEINFYTFDLRAEECRGWATGERSCARAAVDVSVTLEHIQMCGQH